MAGEFRSQDQTHHPRFASLQHALQDPTVWDALSTGAGQTIIGPQESADRIQDTLLAIMNRLLREPGLTIDPSQNPASFLASKARNELRDALRETARRGGQPVSLEELAVVDEDDILEIPLPGHDTGDYANTISVGHGEIWHDLRAAFHRAYKDPKRADYDFRLLFDVFASGLSRPEIIHMYGMTDRAFDSRMWRIRGTLERVIAHDPEFRATWLE